MEKLLYTGKAKQMWQTDDPEVLRVVYMDQATALNISLLLEIFQKDRICYFTKSRNWRS